MATFIMLKKRWGGSVTVNVDAIRTLCPVVRSDGTEQGKYTYVRFVGDRGDDTQLEVEQSMAEIVKKATMAKLNQAEMDEVVRLVKAADLGIGNVRRSPEQEKEKGE